MTFECPLPAELEDGDLDIILAALAGKGYNGSSKAGAGFLNVDAVSFLNSNPPLLSERQANILSAVQEVCLVFSLI